MDSHKLLAEIHTLDDWELGFSGKEISKEFRFKDFSEAMAFANKIADAANAANHHPDLLVSWGKVVVTLTTHDEGGVSEKDLALAREIDGML
jgi:4a-hydroxytetrahydrobiopterin dehydratase